MSYKTKIENLENAHELEICGDYLGDDDVKLIAEAVKGTKIHRLVLRRNNIGCEGVKCLAAVLKDTQIRLLDLRENYEMNEGVKYLLESLKDTQITDLSLSGNNIGLNAIKFFMLSNTKLNRFSFDFEKCISLVYSSNSIELTFNDNRVGSECAQYVNTILQLHHATRICVQIAETVKLESEDADYLAQTFKGTKIHSLKLFKNQITQYSGIEYLVHAFKDSEIYKLDVSQQQIRSRDTAPLCLFLREVRVLSLNLCYNLCCMQILAPAIENSEIMDIDFRKNKITDVEAYHLSKILRNSKIRRLDLCHNKIGVEGAKHLANGLPHSQVTFIHLHGNDIKYQGYKFLLDVIDTTNVSRVFLHCNDIGSELPKDTIFEPNTIPRNIISVADRLCHAFEKLVSLNTTSNEFEFIVPKEDLTSPLIGIDQYPFLVKTLKCDDPNSKVHLFQKMCKWTSSGTYDFDKMKKINEFIEQMPQKFNTFINNNLPALVESFGSCNYVNVVKEFEDMKLHDVVQNLLFHRVLYYVDENQEILHPFIYKLLNKYDMLLYNEQLEPNKKDKIVSFYQDHQEIDGAQEIIELLGSGFAERNE